MKEYRYESSRSVSRLIRRAVEEYNRYRSPESIARLVRISGDKVEIIFSGSFCETCGINDWIDDFRYTLKRFNIDAVLERIEEVEEYSRRGVFRINLRRSLRIK